MRSELIFVKLIVELVIFDLMAIGIIRVGFVWARAAICKLPLDIHDIDEGVVAVDKGVAELAFVVSQLLVFLITNMMIVFRSSSLAHTSLHFSINFETCTAASSFDIEFYFAVEFVEFALG